MDKLLEILEDNKEKFSSQEYKTALESLADVKKEVDENKTATYMVYGPLVTVIRENPNTVVINTEMSHLKILAKRTDEIDIDPVSISYERIQELLGDTAASTCYLHFYEHRVIDQGDIDDGMPECVYGGKNNFYICRFD